MPVTPPRRPLGCATAPHTLSLLSLLLLLLLSCLLSCGDCTAVLGAPSVTSFSPSLVMVRQALDTLSLYGSELHMDDEVFTLPKYGRLTSGAVNVDEEFTCEDVPSRGVLGRNVNVTAGTLLEVNIHTANYPVVSPSGDPPSLLCIRFTGTTDLLLVGELRGMGLEAVMPAVVTPPSAGVEQYVTIMGWNFQPSAAVTLDPQGSCSGTGPSLAIVDTIVISPSTRSMGLVVELNTTTVGGTIWATLCVQPFTGSKFWAVYPDLRFGATIGVDAGITPPWTSPTLVQMLPYPVDITLTATVAAVQPGASVYLSLFQKSPAGNPTHRNHTIVLSSGLSVAQSTIISFPMHNGLSLDVDTIIRVQVASPFGAEPFLLGETPSFQFQATVLTDIPFLGSHQRTAGYPEQLQFTCRSVQMPRVDIDFVNTRLDTTKPGIKARAPFPVERAMNVTCDGVTLHTLVYILPRDSFPDNDRRDFPAFHIFEYRDASTPFFKTTSGGFSILPSEITISVPVPSSTIFREVPFNLTWSCYHENITDVRISLVTMKQSSTCRVCSPRPNLDEVLDEFVVPTVCRVKYNPILNRFLYTFPDDGVFPQHAAFVIRDAANTTPYPSTGVSPQFQIMPRFVRPSPGELGPDGLPIPEDIINQLPPGNSSTYFLPMMLARGSPFWIWILVVLAAIIVILACMCNYRYGWCWHKKRKRREEVLDTELIQDEKTTAHVEWLRRRHGGMPSVFTRGEMGNNVVSFEDADSEQSQRLNTSSLRESAEMSSHGTQAGSPSGSHNPVRWFSRDEIPMPGELPLPFFRDGESSSNVGNSGPGVLPIRPLILSQAVSPSAVSPHLLSPTRLVSPPARALRSRAPYAWTPPE